MKKIFTISHFLLATTFMAKAQITITASDIPIPGNFSLHEYSINIMNLPKGANQTWNIGAMTPAFTNANNYTPETITAWTSIGTDVYIARRKQLTSALGYDVFLEIDHNTNGVMEVGFNVPQQGFELSAFTGSITDSLKMPEQDIIYTSPKILMPFPFAASYNNVQLGRRVVNFTINAPALGLTNMPFTQVMNEVRKDSVIGWGKMRVYTPNGASALYDVLMEKIINYSKDSFYMAGSPAPQQILTAFGVAQGQNVAPAYAIQCNRKGYFNYLYRIFYDKDSTFTLPNASFSHADGISLPTNMQEVSTTNISTFLYPNPSKNTDIKLMIMGDASNYLQFSIIDFTGRTIASDKAKWLNNELQLPTANLPIGNYVVQLSNNHGSSISESFIIK